MANASALPFGGAQFSEVAYGAGINLISNMYTAERMEVFTRSLLYPTAHGRQDRRRAGGNRAALADETKHPGR